MLENQKAARKANMHLIKRNVSVGRGKSVGEKEREGGRCLCHMLRALPRASEAFKIRIIHSLMRCDKCVCCFCCCRCDDFAVAVAANGCGNTLWHHQQQQQQQRHQHWHHMPCCEGMWQVLLLIPLPLCACRYVC